jgi:hypothetical protein
MCFTHNFKDLAFLLAFSRLLPNNRSTTTAGQAINFGTSIAFSADYARQVKGDKTSLFVEFRFVAELANGVQSTNLQSIVSPATIFVVPSLRVKFASGAGTSPWLSGGFGYGIWQGSEFFWRSAIVRATRVPAPL